MCICACCHAWRRISYGGYTRRGRFVKWGPKWVERVSAGAILSRVVLEGRDWLKAVVQRVSRASVEVEGHVVGAIGRGLLVLAGVAKGDTGAEAEYLARKVAALRIFADEAGKMNLSVVKAGGEVLVVSQFTLCADTSRGNRPSFIRAAEPEEGEKLYEHFAEALEGRGVVVKRGVFGAHMRVALVNDGPVTIELEARPKESVKKC